MRNSMDINNPHSNNGGYGNKRNKISAINNIMP